MPNTDQIDSLIEDYGTDLANLMELLKAGKISKPDWAAEFEAIMGTYLQAAFMLGLDSTEIVLDRMAQLATIVDQQLDFFDLFNLVVQSRPDYVNGWDNRAQMYSKAARIPYWKGVTTVLPLPAMPCQGTQCTTNCRCFWRIEVVNSELGDYDCYWEVTASESCQTCVVRHAMWYPLRIRSGVLIQ